MFFSVKFLKLFAVLLGLFGLVSCANLKDKMANKFTSSKQARIVGDDGREVLLERRIPQYNYKRLKDLGLLGKIQKDREERGRVRNIFITKKNDKADASIEDDLVIDSDKITKKDDSNFSSQNLFFDDQNDPLKIAQGHGKKSSGKVDLVKKENNLVEKQELKKDLSDQTLFIDKQKEKTLAILNKDNVKKDVVKKSIKKSSAKQYYIQLGSYSVKTNADNIVKKYQKLADGDVEKLLVKNRDIYRSVLGPFATKNDAEKILARVLDSGHFDVFIIKK